MSFIVCGIKQSQNILRGLLDNNDIVCLTEPKLDDIDIIECNDFTFENSNRKTISSHGSGDIASYILSLNRTLKYTKI